MTPTLAFKTLDITIPRSKRIGFTLTSMASHFLLLLSFGFEYRLPLIFFPLIRFPSGCTWTLAWMCTTPLLELVLNFYSHVNHIFQLHVILQFYHISNFSI
ncbi:hypothetical protein PanWU01x14_218030 [Parasponia andersonii]|uniref:Uncharacterized protein n=1 Tax=Parasponia andersonii TaxID=3476 RepID=A0A2P5BR26_PARAD|nr:hypothetical protein PanWU01x14_218030 [Parasponia andersonii]